MDVYLMFKNFHTKINNRTLNVSVTYIPNHIAIFNAKKIATQNP